MMPTEDDLRGALAHVLWIGGAPDAGKTAVANLLAAKHQLQMYHFDRHEPAHFARATADEHPALFAAHPARMTPDERWVRHPIEQMVRQTIASWTERCAMAIEDLLALPKQPMIVAEGPGFFPECVAPLMIHPHQAIWLVPTEAFKRASAARRDKLTARHETSDPARAQRNWYARDLGLAAHITREANACGLTLLIVDGSRSVEEMAALLEAHFAPLLASSDSGIVGA
ncbi:MAG: hypothetical protein ACYDAR_05445 [Thermomicrobiales bacterium]